METFGKKKNCISGYRTVAVLAQNGSYNFARVVCHLKNIIRYPDMGISVPFADVDNLYRDHWEMVQ